VESYDGYAVVLTDMDGKPFMALGKGGVGYAGCYAHGFFRYRSEAVALKRELAASTGMVGKVVRARATLKVRK
jgi:hypothetical protein